jgi:hypothetical protein
MIANYFFWYILLQYLIQNHEHSLFLLEMISNTIDELHKQ